MKPKHIITLIFSGIFLIFFVIKIVRWNYYHNNTEIKSSEEYTKLSADRIDNPSPNTWYYTRTVTTDTIRTGVFPFLSVKTSRVCYGLWQKAAESEATPLIVMANREGAPVMRQ